MPCQYDSADNFHDGLANVDGGFIDKTGRVVIQHVRGAFIFSEGLARFDSGLKCLKLGYIDKTGQVAIPAIFDEASFFHDGLARVLEKRTYGFIDKTGQMVIEYNTMPAQCYVSDDELPF